MVYGSSSTHSPAFSATCIYLVRGQKVANYHGKGNSTLSRTDCDLVLLSWTSGTADCAQAVKATCAWIWQFTLGDIWCTNKMHATWCCLFEILTLPRALCSNDICAWIRQFLFGDVSCANKMQVYWLFLMLQGLKGRTAKTHIGVSRWPQTLRPSCQRWLSYITPLGVPQTSVQDKSEL